METKTKIIIAYGKPLLRSSLVAFLKNYPEFEIAGESANGRELLNLLKNRETDIVLLDLEMPVMDGMEVLKVMQLRFQNVKTVVLSVRADLANIRDCVLLGACGYLSEDCRPEQLLNTLKHVQAQGFYMEEHIYKGLLHNFVSTSSDTINKKKLSNREREILKELCNGKTEKQIALVLNISKGTVHFHRMNIYSKTNTHNLAELLKYVYENNLL